MLTRSDCGAACRDGQDCPGASLGGVGTIEVTPGPTATAGAGPAAGPTTTAVAGTTDEATGAAEGRAAGGDLTGAAAVTARPDPL